MDRAILLQQNEKFYKKIFPLKNYLREINSGSIEDNFEKFCLNGTLGPFLKQNKNKQTKN